jgi:YVTN family beta-propeller protein
VSGARLAVATTHGHLDLYDVETHQPVARVDGLLAQPHELAWDAHRRLLYLTHTYRSGGYGEGADQEPSHEVSVIDPDTAEVVDVIDTSPYLAPHDVEIDPEYDLLYLSIEDRGGHNGIVVVDLATRKVVGNVPLPEANSHWMALAPDGRTALAAHKEAESISVVDLDAREVVASIPCPGGAEEIDVSPDGRFAYVATPLMAVEVNVAQGALNRRPVREGDPRPRVLKIDVESREVVGALELDEVLCALTVAPDGDLLVGEVLFPDPDDPAATPRDGRVLRVDTATMTVRASYPTQDFPFTTRCTPDGATAYVANLKSGTVTVIDLLEDRVVATLDHHTGTGFGGTHGLAYVPARPADRDQEVDA